MNIKRAIASLPFVRPLFLRLLRATARDVRLTNPWTSDRLVLNSFRHKGYWYFGKDREAATMARFGELIQPGATVIEVGGHIGFITQYFARLAGPSGRVIVFEPGANNLPYITRNTAHLPQVRIEPVAVSDRVGEAVFYEDNITGQNNSLLDDYRGAASVASTHKMEVVKHSRAVRLTTLDAYLGGRADPIDFVKIDVEGHELAVLEGAGDMLRRCRALMVEVTERQADVFALLRRNGYVLSDERGVEIGDAGTSFSGNIFAVRQ